MVDCMIVNAQILTWNFKFCKGFIPYYNFVVTHSFLYFEN
jgi:hypothetical protein